MEELSDEQIWTTFKAGNDEALTYIYNTYVQKLYNYGRQFTPQADLVRDVIQDLFCELIQNRQKLGKTDSIKYYLLACVRHKLVNALKKQEKFALFSLSQPNVGFGIELLSENDFFKQYFALETKEALEKAFNKLPIKQREAVILYFYENLSYEEIAEMLEVGKVKSARALIYRALESLAKNFRHSSHYYSLESIY